MADRRRYQQDLPARRRGLLGGARLLLGVLALIAGLSVLAAPASAVDWTDTAGPCGGELTTPPLGDPLADPAASQWYDCWTQVATGEYLAEEIPENIVQAFGWTNVEFPDGEENPPVETRYEPGELAWLQLHEQRVTNDDLLDTNAALVDLRDLLANEASASASCDDLPPPDEYAGRCDGEGDDYTINAAEWQHLIYAKLDEIGDELGSHESEPAIVQLDPEDVQPIVTASNEIRDGVAETSFGIFGALVGFGFCAFLWRVVRPGRP